LITFRQAAPTEVHDMIELYAEAGYGAAIAPTDTILVAKSDALLVGVVRLCAEEGVTVLRGMQIRGAFQRQGIGAKLLMACQPYLDRQTAFCLPYAHLVHFYAAANFEVATGADLPQFLEQRLSSYLAKGKEVIAMQRPASHSGRFKPTPSPW
jgi:GNAT superfamily N-acetyltransferase